jgi:hypothetical protein
VDPLLARGRRHDPDKDIETIVVPPPQMVANAKVGTIASACEPWNLQLIHQNIGYTAITTGELWDKHPEKSLGMRAAYVDRTNAARASINDGRSNGEAGGTPSRVICASGNGSTARSTT